MFYCIKLILILFCHFFMESIQTKELELLIGQKIIKILHKNNTSFRIF